ncbi:unnamed protein product [Boreogadus saida]
MRTEVVSAESLSVRQPAGVEEIKQLQSFLLQLLERVCWKGEEQIVVGGVEGMVTGAADGGRERAASSLRIAAVRVRGTGGFVGQEREHRAGWVTSSSQDPGPTSPPRM